MDLQYEKKNAYSEISPDALKEVFDYAEGYKKYIDASKTERDAVKTSIEMAKQHGYTEYHFGDELKVGDKVYYNGQNKSLYLVQMGSGDVASEGVRILAAHVDSPRLDLKQVPLYERAGIAMAKTHYYGGVRKYQWVAVPLAMHGVAITKDGNSVDVTVGEAASDPVFYISDLLPHLAMRQSQKTLSEGIEGEQLNIWVGGIPLNGEEANPIKKNVLKYLNDTYGLIEEDLISAELCLVPALEARDVGFDRAFIGAYGHDDKVCAYPELTALFSTPTDRTVIVILADKEEIGSNGATGMESTVLADLLEEIAIARNVNSRRLRANSKCLSADVAAGYDPNFAEVFEEMNSAMISCGAAICKFTGSRGKGGSNDASAEYVGFIRKLLNDNNVKWQMAELGKVDAGGGGTVAKFVAQLNIDTIDIGVPVISMHSPYELISKIDLYELHKACCAFCR